MLCSCYVWCAPILPHDFMAYIAPLFKKNNKKKTFSFFVNSFTFNCVSVLTACIIENISLGSSDRFNFDRLNCLNLAVKTNPCRVLSCRWGIMEVTRTSDARVPPAGQNPNPQQYKAVVYARVTSFKCKIWCAKAF